MKRKRHTPEQIIKKLREADTMLAAGKPFKPAQPAKVVMQKPKSG